MSQVTPIRKVQLERADKGFNVIAGGTCTRLSEKEFRQLYVDCAGLMRHLVTQNKRAVNDA